MVIAAKGRPARTLLATGRKLADDALRESEDATRQSEERCRALSEASFEAIFFSEKGVCIEQNATAEKMFGYTLAEAVGKKGTEWIAAEDRETVMNNMRVGHEERYEVTALRKDGSTFPAEIQARMMQYQGRAVRVTALTDITERKEMETALMESEERFRALVTNTEEIVYVISRDGTFLVSEGKGLSRLGLKPGEVVGQSVFDLYGDYPDMLDAMRRAFDGDSVIGEVDVDGKYFRSWYAPYRNQKNEITGLLGYSINITEQKEAQERERRYQERLKALAFELTVSEERERRRLAVDLHDHAGQSLALARIQIAAAKKAAGDAGLAARLDEVSQTLLEAVHETQTVVYELGSLSMHELGLDAAISEWMESRIASRHGLKTEFTADEPNTRLGDDTQAILFRNVRELLTNVVKHAQASEVSVRMTVEGDALRIVVKDDGVGFDERAVAGARNAEGGFGLFSIRERMGDLGGSLEIESGPGVGCAAVLVVPHPSHDPGGKA
jgi:PAS domain S-box-containing protein